MKKAILFILIIGASKFTSAKPKTIHVFVALCDNEFQGIVPVPAHLGNGKDFDKNLYWGCGYGVRSYFKLKTKDWKLIKYINSNNPYILQRILFKQATKDVYLLADAYDGERIKGCTIDFLKASNGQNWDHIKYQDQYLGFGGKSNLLAYVGHDGLMEFDVDIKYDYPVPAKNYKEVIILACYSKEYFGQYIQKTGAYPLLWTTHLMAPEAYTLKAAIDGWILNEKEEIIEERAAKAYHKYQKCGIKGSRNLFTTGF